MPYYLCACSFDPLLVSNAPLAVQLIVTLYAGYTQPSASHDTQPLNYPPPPSLPSSLSSLTTLLSIPLASLPPLLLSLPPLPMQDHRVHRTCL